MKTKIFTLTLALFFAAFLNAQTVPNGGFEAWTDGEPNEWTTSNLPGNATITQSDDSYSGSYALHGQTDPDETFIPEIISGYDNFGIPVSENYEQLKFHYKYIEDGSDKMVILISISNENYITLGSGYLEIEDEVEDYTLAVIPISYTLPGTAAHAIIQIALVDGFGSGPPSADTYFIIDDVDFTGTTGIDDQVSEAKITIYPNPTTDHFKINIPEDDNYNELEVINQVGQKIYSHTINSSGKTMTVTTDLEAGIYFVRLTGEGIIATEKIIIK